MKRIFTSLSESLKALAALAVLAGAMTSCDSVLDHDDEDCTIEYRVKFKYDYNMKKVDAFSTQVNSVALYAFDKAGKLVYRKTESGARLAEEDYAMAVELVGDYEFITWAGLEPAHFHLPELTPAPRRVRN